MAPLRIVHLGKYYPPAPGGIESHVQTLASAQVMLGAVPRVLCVQHLDRAGKNIMWKTLAYGPPQESMDGPIPIRRLSRIATYSGLDICPQLVAALREITPDNADILHLQTPNPTMILGLCLARPKLPLVITYQSDIVRQRILKHFHRPFEHHVFKNAQMILPTSPKYPGGSKVLQQYPDKLRVLPMGTDLSNYATPTAEVRQRVAAFREQFPGPIWVSCGRLVYYKGLHIGIRALARVPGTYVIVGVGPLKASLQKLAQKLGVADRVVFFGQATPDDLTALYNAARAFWFPSTYRSEAFGLVQSEAMASGCPVINTSIPHSGVDWVSQHDLSGLTVPPHDVDAFALAANRLASDDVLHARLSAGARLRATAEFDRTVMANRSLNLYREAIALYRKADRTAHTLATS
jgi:glycosyltransferase involved in cell wall biosynthesis